MLTSKQFSQLFPKAQDPDSWVSSMNEVFPKYEINTPQRVAAFLAQCGHESGGWTVFEENLNYSAQGLANTWPTRFAIKNDKGEVVKPAKPNTIANQIQRNPVEIANHVYCDRMGNGSYASGEGWKYRGRGPIQLTGKENYTRFAKEMFQDWQNLVDNPDWVNADRNFALMSAIWFWNDKKLNQWVDSGDFKELTRRINGGYNGLEDRTKHYNEAIHLLT